MDVHVYDNTWYIADGTVVIIKFWEDSTVRENSLRIFHKNHINFYESGIKTTIVHTNLQLKIMALQYNARQ